MKKITKLTFSEQLTVRLIAKLMELDPSYVESISKDVPDAILLHVEALADTNK